MAFSIIIADAIVDQAGVDEAASTRNFERNTKSTANSTCESNNNISETSLELSKHGTVVYPSIITLID